MEKTKLKILIENELYPLVLANSEDQLDKIIIDTVRRSNNQFIGKYKEELTIENIDFLTDYIWQVIDKRKNKLNTKNKELEK